MQLGEWLVGWCVCTRRVRVRGEGVCVCHVPCAVLCHLVLFGWILYCAGVQCVRMLIFLLADFLCSLWIAVCCGWVIGRGRELVR